MSPTILLVTVFILSALAAWLAYRMRYWKDVARAAQVLAFLADQDLHKLRQGEVTSDPVALRQVVEDLPIESATHAPNPPTFRVTTQSRRGPVAVLIYDEAMSTDALTDKLREHEDPIVVGIAPVKLDWDDEAARLLRRLSQMLYEVHR